ncbi:substrate-binding domain-containing protein [Actinomadura madurae]|uniref:substrate-binding domain-containing protein n=1 Tax=Actinomadura madurae TaxID=1993 RepID=UPI0027E279AF|nr:substrate-binding domain-containing protein [Actinomadura madurae]
MRRIVDKRIALMAALLLAVTAGCGDTGGAPGTGSGGGGRTLTVFAAASLTEVFGSLGRTFETAHPGVKVRFNFGGSSTLAQQITQGAPGGRVRRREPRHDDDGDRSRGRHWRAHGVHEEPPGHRRPQGQSRQGCGGR